MTMQTGDVRSRTAAPKGAFWNDRDVRAVFFQIVVVVIVVLVGWTLISNTMANLAERHISTGFSYLEREAGFAIGETFISYTPADSYLRALVAGTINTLVVSAIGIVLATILGTIIGIARLSPNWLIAKLASVYVEVLRNTPVLLQLFLWYTIINNLPGAREAISIGDFAYLSSRGLQVPHPLPNPVFDWMFAACAVGIAATYFWVRRAKRSQAVTGKPVPVLLPGIALIIGLPILTYFAGGAPTALEIPKLGRFNFDGGSTLTPEFVALTFGLTIYTASYIAEIVRAGIIAVSQGQWEAARALGIPNGRILRLIILPQSLRVIVPPVTSQYLNLTKNSSLAVAIGFPDLVSVGNTTLNQTGQAIENIALFMAVYLTISLSISAFMNWYNARIALIER